MNFNKINNLVTDVNEKFLNMFKYTKEECIGKNLDDLIILKEKKDEAQANTINLFKKEKLDLTAIRHTKYGEAIYVNVRGILMKDKGEVLGGYAIYTDITEKVNYQQQLESTNAELEAVIGQLTASEEELRAQYDEIQTYSEKNEELKQKYEIAIKATNSFVWELDKDFNLTHPISDNVKNVLGFNLLSENLWEFIKKSVLPEDQQKFMKEFKDHKAGIKDEINTQIRIIDKTGKIRWYLVKGKKILDRLGECKSINGVIIEITDIKEKEQYIQFLADHDPLTGIYNRRKFREILEKELEEGKKGGILLLDLDNFKNINNTLGHAYGDNLLKKIVETLIMTKIQKEEFFRIGGDEFVVLLKEDKIEEIKVYAREILNILKEKINLEGVDHPITASIGIVTYPSDGQDIDELFKKADIAMYQAKFSGKNKYLLFNEEMKIQFNQKINVENILRKALQEEKLLLYYQPIIEAASGKIAYFEALLRLKDINLSPAVFIPIAEESDIIIQIGKWVINQVAKQIKFWQEKGLDIKPVAINISPKQFSDDRFMKYLTESLRTNNIQASLIEIEITENVLVENKEETIKKLKDIRKLGIKIALDDFGTGYSSLNYLTYMPIDKIKMDKSLKDKFIELDKIQIIDSMILIAHSLGLKVVAEGIEELEEYRRLKKGMCDYIQGYFFSKPVDKNEVEKMLEDDERFAFVYRKS